MKIIIQICDFLPVTSKWRDYNQVVDTIVGAGGDSRFGEQILFWYHSPPLSGTRALKWVELNFINKYYQIFCLNTISLPDPSFCGLVSVTLIVVVYLPPLISSQSVAVDSSIVASPALARLLKLAHSAPASPSSHRRDPPTVLCWTHPWSTQCFPTGLPYCMLHQARWPVLWTHPSTTGSHDLYVMNGKYNAVLFL